MVQVRGVFAAVVVAAAVFGVSGARLAGQDRLPPLAPGQMTEAQTQAAAEFLAARGGTSVAGPFAPFLRTPDLLNRVRGVSDYFRGRSALPPRLRELVILITAREWTNQFEWVAHQQAAADAGVKAEVVAAIAERRRPAGLAADEEAVVELLEAIYRREGVSDQVYARAVAQFGEATVVDVTSLAGYYSWLGILGSVARTPPPGGAAPALSGR